MGASSFDVEGKVALVTGAAKGIGYETALALHARGASVAMIDLNRAETEASAARVGERTLAIQADVTDAGEMRRITDEVAERFGGLDIVVANAGIAPPTVPMSVVDTDVFERVIEVDLLGVWRTVKPALPHIIQRKGHIVVVASVYAFLNGVMAAPYAMSKAGVEALGRSLRVELSPHGASAGVAYFGFIDTDMVRDAMADPIAQKVEQAFPAFMRKRLTPAVAGGAIADGIEKRGARTIRPKWWAAWSTLRGVVNPVMDRAAMSDDAVVEAVQKGERREREAA